MSAAKASTETFECEWCLQNAIEDAELMDEVLDPRSYTYSIDEIGGHTSDGTSFCIGCLEDFADCED